MITRTKVIAGNWKMNMSRQETEMFLQEFGRLYQAVTGTETVICPPYIWLDQIGKELPAGVKLGAQNCYTRDNGAFTGEISVAMLKDVGCTYVIIGHSERRQLMGEDDNLVREKVRQVLANDLVPLVCVGESEEQRNNNQAQTTVARQLQGALADLDFNPGSLIIAYEPVWAIGTGKTASTDDAQEMAFFIRSWLQRVWGASIAAQTQILYGGSVSPDNAEALLNQPDIDGALVGGASLNPTKFWSIITSGRSQ